MSSIWMILTTIMQANADRRADKDSDAPDQNLFIKLSRYSISKAIGQPEMAFFIAGANQMQSL